MFSVSSFLGMLQLNMKMAAKDTSNYYSLKYFFLLVFVLSIPLWLLGGTKLPLPVKLPVSALTAFVPMIAALILSFQRHGIQGIKELFQMAWDCKKIKDKIWYFPILLLAPLLYVLSFAIMQIVGRPLPDAIDIPWLWLPVFFGMYLVTGAGEELGWSAYVTPPLLNRWGAIPAGLLLGSLWALWHSIAFVQTGSPIDWVVWQSMKTVAMRVIMIWIYTRTGRSVFAAILYHTTDNVGWSLFPNFATHYDPAVTGLLNGVVVIIIILAGRLNSIHRQQAGNNSSGVPAKSPRS
jgi:membrane protease YdiL (CAAX protease family)